MSNEEHDDVVGGGIFDNEKFGDVHHKEFEDARVGVHTNPTDGLPSPVFDSRNDKVAPLTHDTFVCMADEREFVRRDDFGNIRITFDPSLVNLSPNDTFWVSGKTFKERATDLGLEPMDLAEELGMVIRLHRNKDDTIPDERVIRVDPVRYRCSHLIEMMVGFEGGYDRVMVTRMCGLCRGDNGEFISLHNEMVVACIGREPQDFVSVDRLRKFDAKIIKAGAERVAAGDCFKVSSLDEQPDELEGVVS